MSRPALVPSSMIWPWAAVSARIRVRARMAAVATLLSAGALFGLAATSTGAALAQGGPASAILIDGNAVVTGFSGTQPPLPLVGPDAADRTTIDPNGPAARIVDLQAPGAPPQAQLLTTPKPFTVLAGQIGQVFAVALDSATPPNIYLAATSAYGLPIVVPAPNGTTVRAKAGSPNASFMPGLFGPAALGGGPGSIWRIDGVTGEVRLFANVTLDGVPNSGPALGGLAFDAAANTLFVADRETGMIHRFDLSGRERGRFDHGVQGRMAAGLSAVPYDPTTRLDISNPQFQPDNPATWAYAPLEREIFGLSVQAGRLYYAVADGLQIWSVAISPDGTFGADPRIEIQVSPWDGGSEISKITFDNPGRMLLAERPAQTGAYDFAALAKPGVGRVLRYRGATPANGGRAVWQPDPDEYAIGFAADMRNGNGGVAVGYGYTPTGQIDHAACSAFLWSTGEQLRKAMDPALIARLAQGGPANVDGLQGNALGLVRPANVPPLQSYFVDYDDSFSDDTARGHLGDVAIWRICGQALVPSPPQVPFGLIGEGGGCRRGEVKLRDGGCCAREFVQAGRCFPPPPSSCPPDQIRLPDGQCCDREYVRDGRCLPPNTCPLGEIRLPNGQCCDRENVRDGRCLPPNTCPLGQIRLPSGQCCDRENVRDGRCLPPNTCPPGQIKLPNGQCCDRQYVKDGRCLPPPVNNNCPRGEIMVNGQCCPSADVHDGRCVQIQIRKEIRPRFHLPKVDEPREPVRHEPRFHMRIPSGVIMQPRGPSPPAGRRTISRPHSGENSLIR
jgi:CC domain-containing protein